MRRKRAGAMVVGALLALIAATESAGDGTETVAPPAPAGMRVYIDPETGELAAPPPGRRDAQAPAVLQGLPADQELVEQVNPAGGYTIDLERRFGGFARAVAAPAGVEVECEAGEKPAEK